MFRNDLKMLPLCILHLLFCLNKFVIWYNRSLFLQGRTWSSRWLHSAQEHTCNGLKSKIYKNHLQYIGLMTNVTNCGLELRWISILRHGDHNLNIVSSGPEGELVTFEPKSKCTLSSSIEPTFSWIETSPWPWSQSCCGRAAQSPTRSRSEAEDEVFCKRVSF